MKSYFMNCSLICNTARTASSIAILAAFHFITSLYAALLLGYTIHFIYCIWGNLRIAAAAASSAGLASGGIAAMPGTEALAALQGGIDRCGQ